MLLFFLKKKKKKMDCKFTVVTPEPMFVWGSVENGEATGLLKPIADDAADFSIGAIFGHYGRQRVSTYTTFLDYGEALTIVTPMSVPKRYFPIFDGYLVTICD